MSLFNRGPNIGSINKDSVDESFADKVEVSEGIVKVNKLTNDIDILIASSITDRDIDGKTDIRIVYDDDSLSLNGSNDNSLKRTTINGAPIQTYDICNKRIVATSYSERKNMGSILLNGVRGDRYAKVSVNTPIIRNDTATYNPFSTHELSDVIYTIKYGVLTYNFHKYGYVTIFNDIDGDDVKVVEITNGVVYDQNPYRNDIFYKYESVSHSITEVKDNGNTAIVRSGNDIYRFNMDNLNIESVDTGFLTNKRIISMDIKEDVLVLLTTSFNNGYIALNDGEITGYVKNLTTGKLSIIDIPKVAGVLVNTIMFSSDDVVIYYTYGGYSRVSKYSSFIPKVGFLIGNIDSVKYVSMDNIDGVEFISTIKGFTIGKYLHFVVFSNTILDGSIVAYDKVNKNFVFKTTSVGVFKGINTDYRIRVIDNVAIAMIDTSTLKVARVLDGSVDTFSELDLNRFRNSSTGINCFNTNSDGELSVVFNDDISVRLTKTQLDKYVNTQIGYIKDFGINFRINGSKYVINRNKLYKFNSTNVKDCKVVNLISNIIPTGYKLDKYNVIVSPNYENCIELCMVVKNDTASVVLIVLIEEVNSVIDLQYLTDMGSMISNSKVCNITVDRSFYGVSYYKNTNNLIGIIKSENYGCIINTVSGIDITQPMVIYDNKVSIGINNVIHTFDRSDIFNIVNEDTSIATLTTSFITDKVKTTVNCVSNGIFTSNLIVSEDGLSIDITKTAAVSRLGRFKHRVDIGENTLLVRDGILSVIDITSGKTVSNYNFHTKEDPSYVFTSIDTYYNICGDLIVVRTSLETTLTDIEIINKNAQVIKSDPYKLVKDGNKLHIYGDDFVLVDVLSSIGSFEYNKLYSIDTLPDSFNIIPTSYIYKSDEKTSYISFELILNYNDKRSVKDLYVVTVNHTTKSCVLTPITKRISVGGVIDSGVSHLHNLNGTIVLVYVENKFVVCRNMTNGNEITLASNINKVYNLNISHGSIIFVTFTDSNGVIKCESYSLGTNFGDNSIGNYIRNSIVPIDYNDNEYVKYFRSYTRGGTDSVFEPITVIFNSDGEFISMNNKVVKVDKGVVNYDTVRQELTKSWYNNIFTLTYYSINISSTTHNQSIGLSYDNSTSPITLDMMSGKDIFCKRGGYSGDLFMDNTGRGKIVFCVDAGTIIDPTHMVLGSRIIKPEFGIIQLPTNDYNTFVNRSMDRVYRVHKTPNGMVSEGYTIGLPVKSSWCYYQDYYTVNTEGLTMSYNGILYDIGIDYSLKDCKIVKTNFGNKEVTVAKSLPIDNLSNFNTLTVGSDTYLLMKSYPCCDYGYNNIINLNNIASSVYTSTVGNKAFCINGDQLLTVSYSDGSNGNIVVVTVYNSDKTVKVTKDFTINQIVMDSTYNTEIGNNVILALKDGSVSFIDIDTLIYTNMDNFRTFISGFDTGYTYSCINRISNSGYVDISFSRNSEKFIAPGVRLSFSKNVDGLTIVEVVKNKIMIDKNNPMVYPYPDMVSGSTYEPLLGYITGKNILNVDNLDAGVIPVSFHVGNVEFNKPYGSVKFVELNSVVVPNNGITPSIFVGDDMCLVQYANIIDIYDIDDDCVGTKIHTIIQDPNITPLTIVDVKFTNDRVGLSLSNGVIRIIHIDWRKYTIDNGFKDYKEYRPLKSSYELLLTTTGLVGYISDKNISVFIKGVVRTLNNVVLDKYVLDPVKGCIYYTTGDQYVYIYHIDTDKCERYLYIKYPIIGIGLSDYSGYIYVYTSDTGGNLYMYDVFVDREGLYRKFTGIKAPVKLIRTISTLKY